VPVSKAVSAPGWALGSGIGGLVMILATGVLLKGGAAFPGWIALLPVVGTLAMLFAGTRTPQRGISALLSVAPLQFLGARSYSWYLWHWPFVVFGAALFPGISIAGKIGTVLASLLAATLTFSLVERPVRQSSYLGARSRLSLGLAAGTTLVATVVASWTLTVYERQLALDQNLQSIHAAARSIADISERDCVSTGLSTDARTCVYGAPDAARTVVLFGDSHALQWFNPLRTAALQEAWRLVTVLKNGCPASSIHPHPMSTATQTCDEWRIHAIDKIVAMHPSAIIMATYTGATIRGFETETPLSLDALRLGTRSTLEGLVRAGVPVVVMRDTPLPPFDVSACVVRRALNKLHAAENCDFDPSTALNEAAFSAERAAAENLRNIYFLDLSDLFCPDNSCRAIQSGILVYQDDNHMTGMFAETLAPALRTRLFQLLHDALTRSAAESIRTQVRRT